MPEQLRDHYSRNFCFDVERKKNAVDRFSPWVLFVAVFFGVMLCALGYYRIISAGLLGTADIEKNLGQSGIFLDTILSPKTFSVLVFVVGSGIIATAVFYLLRFKTVSFDGTSFTLADFPVFGKVRQFTEPLCNYRGVRLRVKFYQYGILNKNKFIIELYHEDESKNIPLYISSNPKHIRRIWKNYAKTFELPLITVSDKGMVSYNLEDMDKPFADVIKSWHLSSDFFKDKTHSDAVACFYKNNGKLLRVMHTIIDAYSFLNVFVMVVLGAMLVYMFQSHQVMLKFMGAFYLLALYVLMLTIVIYAFINLTQKDLLLIKNKKMYLFRKIFFFNFEEDAFSFENIRGFRIVYTPTTDRYALHIMTDEKFVVFGNKLSVNDLRWVRAFLVRELIAD